MHTCWNVQMLLELCFDEDEFPEALHAFLVFSQCVRCAHDSHVNTIKLDYHGEFQMPLELGFGEATGPTALLGLYAF